MYNILKYIVYIGSVVSCPLFIKKREKFNYNWNIMSSNMKYVAL